MSGIHNTSGASSRRQTQPKPLLGSWLRLEILFWLILGFCVWARSEDARPNIVLIFADDLGWTDLSTGAANLGAGSDFYKTPRIDSIASSGVAFTHAYSCGPNCAPTRAALMSGRYAPHTGIYTVGNPNRGAERFRKLNAPPNKTSLDPRFKTLAEVLQETGYKTGHFGKWHLGNEGTGSGPTEQGFDVNIGGTLAGTVSGGSQGHFAKADGSFNLPGLVANGVDGEFIADRLTTEAIQFMKSCKTQPFFSYLSHFSVHTPIQAPQEDEDSFKSAPKGKHHSNVTYAGMLKNLDDNVGRILDFLTTTTDPRNPKSNLLNNTLILFISDNGGLGGYKDAGVPGSPEITHQFPLQSGKGSLFEGGIRVPCLVQWKGKLPAGVILNTPTITLDWFPTLIRAAGVNVSDYNLELDGIDLMPWMLDPSKTSPNRPLFWHFPAYLQSSGNGSTWRTTPASVILRGPWKAHFYYENREWKLFNLDHDISEKDNLIEIEKKQLELMAEDLFNWLQTNDAALPMDKLSGKPEQLPNFPEANGIK
jgi:arylsulfatase A-like enzyme